MFKLNTLYHPITAQPFERSASYCELAPCEALQPYIRCFWGTDGMAGEGAAEGAVWPASQPIQPAPRVVIPDTCMDVIFSISYTRGSLEAAFCALDEQAHLASTVHTEPGTATFGIRFYAWSAVLFAEDSLAGSKNCCFDAGQHFLCLKQKLSSLLAGLPTLAQRAQAAQDFLLGQLDAAVDRQRKNSDLMNAVYFMLSTCGRETVAQTAAYAAISPRQLERIFSGGLGLSPKSLASLVRYQLMWQEIARSGIVSLDAVEKYGYFDEAHMINDFRRRHLCTPQQAAAGLRALR